MENKNNCQIYLDEQLLFCDFINKELPLNTMQLKKLIIMSEKLSCEDDFLLIINLNDIKDKNFSEMKSPYYKIDINTNKSIKEDVIKSVQQKNIVDTIEYLYIILKEIELNIQDFKNSLSIYNKTKNEIYYELYQNIQNRILSITNDYNKLNKFLDNGSFKNLFLKKLTEVNSLFNKIEKTRFL